MRKIVFKRLFKFYACMMKINIQVGNIISISLGIGDQEEITIPDEATAITLSLPNGWGGYNPMVIIIPEDPLIKVFEFSYGFTGLKYKFKNQIDIDKDNSNNDVIWY